MKLLKNLENRWYDLPWYRRELIVKQFVGFVAVVASLLISFQIILEKVGTPKQPEPLPVIETIEVEPLREDLTRKDDQIKLLEEVIESKNQEIAGYEELLASIVEEHNNQVVAERAAYFAQIAESSRYYKERTQVTETQTQQIRNWLMKYAGPKEAKYEAFHAYLRSLMSEEQYADYKKCEKDRRERVRMARASSLLGDLQEMLDLSDEQKDAIYESAYLSTSDEPPFREDDEAFIGSLSEILNETQMNKVTKERIYEDE